MQKRFISIVLLLSLLSIYLPPPQHAEAALLSATAPVLVQNVTYTYQDKVQLLSLSPATRLGNTLLWPGAEFSPGDILVDETLQQSAKILRKLDSGAYLIAKPSMYDLFREFSIPRQEIIPKPDNMLEYAVKGIDIDAFLTQQSTQAPGSTTTQTLFSSDGPGLMQDIRMKFNQRGTKIYEYDGTYTFHPFGTTNPADTVKLALRGALGVSPSIVAEYSLFDGYEFGFVDTAQFIELNLMFDVALNEEVYLPVFAVSVPIPGLGSIKIGVYLVVDVNGDITLTVKASEGVMATASVHGGTSFGVPTSFHLSKDYEHYSDAECDPMGNIEAGLYITPLVNLEILDVDVFGAQLRLGFYTYATTQEHTMSYGVDFVLHAFVVILDDPTDLFKLQEPLLQRNKSFNPADDVIFYFSRLCVYQDRLNLAAMTKRMAGATTSNAPPFSDKEPFALRTLEIKYYRNGTDAKQGTATPDYLIPIQTDGQGAATVDLSTLDVQKGDQILIHAPGFQGQTDLIQASTPFGAEKVAGKTTDFYGNSRIWADFFEEKVSFPGLSGPDLTVLDVPNIDLDFQTQSWIKYQGPVKLFATSVLTQQTEEAWIHANGVDTEYKPWLHGSFDGVNTMINQAYNVKPNHEMRWQVNVDGFLYGTFEPTGAGGHLTSHHVTVHRMIEDYPVVILDLAGKTIGIQHQVALHVVAVNHKGSRTYNGSADLAISLGRVPEGYTQSFAQDQVIQDIGTVQFPAADVRYPLHYEYYVGSPFPDLLYEMPNEPQLNVSVANNQTLSQIPLTEGAVSMAHFLWKWEERLQDVPATVDHEEWQIVLNPATGRPMNQLVTVSEPNWFLAVQNLSGHPEFNAVPVSYVYAVDGDTADALKTGDLFQTRHVVSGMSIEGVALKDPSVIPPAPVIYHYDDYLPTDARHFDLLFQLEQLRSVDRFVVNPLDFVAEMGMYRGNVAVQGVAVSYPVTITNFAEVPDWSKNYVSSVVNAGIMPLDAWGRFSAGVSTTRAEFAGAVVRALGLTEADAVRQGFPFGDVDLLDADREAMELAYQCGVINGRSDVVFAPGDTVTRQDAATMLLRAFGLRNADLVPADDAAKLQGFADQTAISDYAEKGMAQAVALGFFNGYTDGTLKPQKQILNEQTAKIVWEMKLTAKK